MSLPLSPPLPPQLARSRSTLPDEPGWAFEPKWDGFRAIAFVDGDGADVRSRNDRPLTRYFPELSFPAGRYVLDGEIVVRDARGREDFDALGQRIHPAASRIERLSVETPAVFVAFDLLARDDELLMELPYAERRAALEALVRPPAERRAALEALVREPVELTPMVLSAAEAERWLHEAEGVIAKQLDAPYRPGERAGMLKIKRVRTIDAVVMGWRPGKAQGTVGALILGLYEPDGRLREVGHSSGFTAKEKHELVEFLRPYESGERGSAAPSRWTAGRDLEWVSLRPELVVEITFDHTSAGRIRHGAKVRRWREDKPPAECVVAQLDS